MNSLFGNRDISAIFNFKVWPDLQQSDEQLRLLFSLSDFHEVNLEISPNVHSQLRWEHRWNSFCTQQYHHELIILAILLNGTNTAPMRAIFVYDISFTNIHYKCTFILH